ncbi:TIGR04211 family SH3 domain-containing protein [Orbaceae bacterium ac157xtp]
MKKQTLTFFSALLLSFSCLATDSYITDDLSVFLRRGPSTNYGLSGSLKSGDKVTILDKSSDGQYLRIQDEKGRIAWVESSAISQQQPLKEQVSQLQQEISTLKEKVNNNDKTKQNIVNDYTNKLNQANEKIAQLEKTNQQLEEQNQTFSSQIETLTNQVDQNRQDLMLTWFTRGGMVAGIGLILGLILPIIIPKRRKKDRWMS